MVEMGETRTPRPSESHSLVRLGQSLSACLSYPFFTVSLFFAPVGAYPLCLGPSAIRPIRATDAHQQPLPQIVGGGRRRSRKGANRRRRSRTTAGQQSKGDHWTGGLMRTTITWNRTTESPIACSWCCKLTGTPSTTSTSGPAHVQTVKSLESARKNTHNGPSGCCPRCLVSFI